MSNSRTFSSGILRSKISLINPLGTTEVGRLNDSIRRACAVKKNAILLYKIVNFVQFTVKGDLLTSIQTTESSYYTCF